MTDDELKQRYAHIFNGLSDRDLHIFEGGMAKEPPKEDPLLRQFSEAEKQAVKDVSQAFERSKLTGTGEDLQAGGNVHNNSFERAKVKELPGRGGPEGVATDSVTYDPHKPAPRIDIADAKTEPTQAKTLEFTDKHPELKKAAEEAELIYGGKDGKAPEKNQDQAQQKGYDGKDNGKDI